MTITIEPVITVAATPTSPPPIGTSRLDGRAGVASWPATCRDYDAVFEVVTNPPFVLASPASQKQRRRGVALLLDWLVGYPGQAWQQRWLASGVDSAGGHWRDIPARWLHGQGRPGANASLDALCAAVPVIIGADVVRPSIDWFVRAVPRGGALARTMAQTRDIEGFARLQKACDEDAHLPAAAAPHTRHRAATCWAPTEAASPRSPSRASLTCSTSRRTRIDGRWRTPWRSTARCTGWVSWARTRRRPCNRCAAAGRCPANS